MLVIFLRTRTKAVAVFLVIRLTLLLIPVCKAQRERTRMAPRTNTVAITTTLTRTNKPIKRVIHIIPIKDISFYPILILLLISHAIRINDEMFQVKIHIIGHIWAEIRALEKDPPLTDTIFLKRVVGGSNYQPQLERDWNARCSETPTHCSIQEVQPLSRRSTSALRQGPSSAEDLVHVQHADLRCHWSVSQSLLPTTHLTLLQQKGRH